MKRERLPSLTDLAFEGRNKEYGAYFLHRKYYRNLIISAICGFILMVLLFLVPLFYYAGDQEILIDDDFLYEVEYYTMKMPTEDELSELAQAFAKPPDPVEAAPVVTDSVVEKEEKKPEEPPARTEPENLKTDSAATAGGSGLGDGVGDDKGIVTMVDVHPRFPGGDQARLFFLRKNIRYPDEAIRKNIQGVVMVVFVVELDGSVSNLKVLTPLGGGCDEEAIRVTGMMPRWEPGKRQGKSVRVMVRMPIVFRIPGKPG